MTTKVKHTESLKTSQGDVIVTKGKLILIKCESPKNEDEQTKLIEQKSKYSYNVGGWFKPIIISEIEEIEVGYKVFNKFTFNIKLADKDDLLIKDAWFKVLAMPENFSPKHLQAITDGKLKDGDEVWVECHNLLSGTTNNLQVTGHCIGLNNNDKITLHKVEQKTYTQAELDHIVNNERCKVVDQMLKKGAYTKEETENLIRKALYEITGHTIHKYGINKWIEENLK
jgi:hypothetical protein